MHIKMVHFLIASGHTVSQLFSFKVLANEKAVKILLTCVERLLASFLLCNFYYYFRSCKPDVMPLTHWCL